jgi:hypothetical protein
MKKILLLFLFIIIHAAAQANPSGPASGVERVIRGGSWGNRVWESRVLYRASDKPDFRTGALGFRLASESIIEVQPEANSNTRETTHP